MARDRVAGPVDLTVGGRDRGRGGQLAAVGAVLPRVRCQLARDQQSPSPWVRSGAWCPRPKPPTPVEASLRGSCDWPPITRRRGPSITPRSRSRVGSSRCPTTSAGTAWPCGTGWRRHTGRRRRWTWPGRWSPCTRPIRRRCTCRSPPARQAPVRRSPPSTRALESSIVRVMGMRRTMWAVPAELVPIVAAACGRAIAAERAPQARRRARGAGRRRRTASAGSTR